MKPIETVYVLGLGALGGMYAARLADTREVHTGIIADAARIERYRSAGVRINGKPYEFTYFEAGSHAPPADLVLVAVKQPQLEEAIEALTPYVGADTTVISLLNGISSEEIIGSRLGMEHLLHAYAVGMDAVRESAEIRYTNMGRIVFGEHQNPTRSERVDAVAELFDAAGIPYTIPQDMVRAQWSKFMLNVGINQCSAILRAPYGVFQNDEQARELMLMASREVVEISEKIGIGLGEDDLREFLAIIGGLDPEGKTSMLQDIEAARKTEVDIYSGAVIELGRRYGVATPVNEVLYRAISVLERTA